MNFGNQVGVGGYGNTIPAQQQAALRDPYSISPGQLQDVYAQQGMPGFGPEIMYFTPEKGAVVNPFKDWVPDPIAVPVEDGGGTTGSETGGVNTTDKFIEIDLGGIGGGKIQIPNPPTFRLKANLKANPPPKQRLEQQPRHLDQGYQQKIMQTCTVST